MSSLLLTKSSFLYYSSYTPSLILFSSVAPYGYSRRSVDIACIIYNFSVSFTLTYFTFCNMGPICFVRK